VRASATVSRLKLVPGHSPEPIVELQQIFTELFDRAGFDFVIDYQIPLSPLITADDLGI
jgi:Protein of unknown function (DUF4058)